jgi:peroxiredoxin
LADYRDHYNEIRAAGAEVGAISVDPPENSEPLRRGLRLPFPILCDTERRVVHEWDIYNPRERGGVAKPAVFVIERDRRVRYAAMDGVASRAPAAEVLRLLRNTGESQSVRCKVYIPQLADWLRAIRNSIRAR